jgi:FemAB-related protein (PEP-CTERM system-associated)
MTLRIEPLSPANQVAWDEFVANQPQATFFHQAAMPGLIARCFRHRDHSVLATQDGCVVGVLPLVELRTRLFGHALMSLPFCVYGGALAADEAAGAALLAHAVRRQEQAGAASLELRTLGGSVDGWAGGEGWQARANLYATFRRAITGDDDANLKSVPRKQRAVIRKGLERRLDVTVGQDAATLHRIYAESVRNLGSPVFPRSWFEGLLATFPGAADVTIVGNEGKAVAAVLNFHWRDQVLPYYGGGLPEARACQAYDVMYWEVMRRAAARGARLFDFGRSKEGTGAYAFKKNWGFEPTPLTYHFHLRPGQSIPEHNPLNPKYRLMIAAWRRLPLPVANRLGPILVRGVG